MNKCNVASIKKEEIIVPKVLPNFMYNDLKMIELYSKDEVLFNELRKGFYIFLILSLVILILFG